MHTLSFNVTWYKWFQHQQLYLADCSLLSSAQRDSSWWWRFNSNERKKKGIARLMCLFTLGLVAPEDLKSCCEWKFSRSLIRNRCWWTGKKIIVVLAYIDTTGSFNIPWCVCSLTMLFNKFQKKFPHDLKFPTAWDEF